MLVDWNHRKTPFFSEPPVLYATHAPSGPAKTIATCTSRRRVPQIVRALCTPFALFGEVDTEAEDIARRRHVFGDGNVEGEAHGDMQIKDDNNAILYTELAQTLASSSSAGL